MRKSFGKHNFNLKFGVFDLINGHLIANQIFL